MEEGTLKKWFRFEAGKIAKSLVVRKKCLEELLLEEEPRAERRDGKPYIFEKDSLRKFGILPEKLRKKLYLPIDFYLDLDVEGSCFLKDINAIEALRILGEINPKLEPREGKLWISKPIANQIANKYRSFVQWVIC
jgi:uncharacterized protein (UPF0216 family)